MKTDKREVVIFYNPTINKHKKTIAHAKSIADDIITYSFEDMPNADNIWSTVWDSMHKNPMGIFDEKHEKYDELIKGREFAFESWLKIVKNNRDMIASPIAVRGTQVVVCHRQTEIYKLMDTTDIPQEKLREITPQSR